MSQARKGRWGSLSAIALMASLLSGVTLPTSAAEFPVGNLETATEAQEKLAFWLLDEHPPGFSSLKLRAELAPDNSASNVTYFYADGHWEDGPWSLEFERLCRALQQAMRGPDGKMWKVMLMVIEMPRGHIKTEFEWEDSARWDPDPKYRQPSQNW